MDLGEVDERFVEGVEVVVPTVKRREERESYDRATRPNEELYRLLEPTT